MLPVDLLPKHRLRRTPRLFIVNTDESTGPGEHWVLVFFTGHNRGIYFDSYGLDVMDTRIEDFITKTVQAMYITKDPYKDFSVTPAGFSVSMWGVGWPEDFHFDVYSVPFGHLILIIMIL